MSRYWYTYNGLTPDTAVGHYVAPSRLQPTCASGGVTCAIYVPAGGTNPPSGAITKNISDYLAIAKANSFSFYPLAGTIFVGTRPS